MATSTVKNEAETCYVKVKFTLEEATKAQWGSRGIALIFNLGATWGGWSTPRPGRFTPGKDPGTPCIRKLLRDFVNFYHFDTAQYPEDRNENHAYIFLSIFKNVPTT
jgi:hypothetical protein